LSKTEPYDALASRLASLKATHWSDVWAAWCPNCRQECVPMPSGRCGFCDASLVGQPMRNWNEPPLLEGRLTVRAIAWATSKAA
jgi:hypothetical protein